METKVKRFSATERAIALLNAGEPDGAWEIINQQLTMNPNNAEALLTGTMILAKARTKVPLAYQLARRAIDVAPHASQSWTNFGSLSEQLYQLEDAEAAYRKAIKLALKPHHQLLGLNNLASFYNTIGWWDEAEKTARMALLIDPEHRKSRGNLGIAQLAKHEWRDGWGNYDYILGSEYRKIFKVRDEPTWAGEPDAEVVVYGEQGMGDELSFASMLPDAIARARKVIVQCDQRLLGLFRRSFPQAKCYGGRWERDIVVDEEDAKPTHSISIGQLGGLFRLSESDFPGTPYIKADPERVAMWAPYLKSKRKPVIGLAWSGGLPWTADRFRRWELHELQPFFDAVDAHWVSLQYQDAEEEINDFPGAQIHQYKFATLSKDYDDTAGLVAACDLVIGIQTSACHLSAALGIPTWCFVNRFSQWRYGRDDVPWYKAMQVWRADLTGKWPIEEAARVLRLRYSTLGLRSA